MREEKRNIFACSTESNLPGWKTQLIDGSRAWSSGSEARPERAFTAGPPRKRLSSVQCQTHNCETNCGSDINLPVALTSLNVEIVVVPLPGGFVQQHRVGEERRETLSWRLTVPPTSAQPFLARHTYRQLVSVLKEKLSSRKPASLNLPASICAPSLAHPSHTPPSNRWKVLGTRAQESNWRCVFSSRFFPLRSHSCRQNE